MAEMRNKRFQAAKLVNKELLSLYYAVGRYVSLNSRGNWGQGAIKRLSDDMKPLLDATEDMEGMNE